MSYGPQGIFAEGRALDFRQEEGSVTQEHGTSTGNYCKVAKRKADCERCGTRFAVTKGSVGRYCSRECMNQHRVDSRPIGFECSVCLASIGIGMNVASRLLGVTKASIHRSWRKEGIRASVPECGDWRRYSIQHRAANRGWWGCKEAESGWMDQHKEVFPDWSSVWTAEQQRRQSVSYYHSLTDEEKLVRNRRLMDQRIEKFKTDPVLKAAHRHRINQWKKDNPEKSNASVRKCIAKRKIIDPGFRVQCNLRNRFKELMGTARKGGSDSASSLIGCSTRQLAAHLESKFTKRMSWANYGTYWHVDHILPCASFDHNDPKQRAQCWHWTNLQPLEAKKNMDKSDTITNPQMSLLLCASR